MTQMSWWIEQAKKKLFAIIEQTRKEADNLELRVAFVGCVTHSCGTGMAFFARAQQYPTAHRATPS